METALLRTELEAEHTPQPFQAKGRWVEDYHLLSAQKEKQLAR
jgi:hypothetical protein